MKKELEKQSQIEDLTNTLKRLQAEFENYKKRVEKENIEFRKTATEDLIKELLPVLDSFDIALKNTNNQEEFAKGVKLIQKQFKSILEKEGLKEIKCINEKFDPYKHEVLLTEQCDKDENCIVEEIQKGYILGDKIIRHSKVKISKPAEEKNGNQ